MTAYYNEIDRKAAAWLRELIRAGAIAPGEVDERSIKDVQPDDLEGFTQCHFFAGIGVWSYALRRASWPDDRPVWTGSCPCQPFSAAGKGEGLDDPRHLWPDWFRLIRERRPVAVFGEQVAGKDGLAWIDLVHADLEGAAYTVGAVDTCSAGFGSPNIRQRLYWMAHASGGRAERHGFELAGQARGSESAGDQRQRIRAHAGDGGDADRLADPAHALGRSGERGEEAGARPHGERGRGSAGGSDPRRLADTDGGQPGDGGLQRGGQHGLEPQDGEAGRVGDTSSGGRGELGDAALARGSGHVDGADEARGLGDAERAGPQGREPSRLVELHRGAQPHGSTPAAGIPRDRPGPTNGFWRAADWLCCTDGRWRPVESGTFPLVTGAPARLVRLRGFGNGLNAEVATAFVEAYLDHERAA